MRRTEVVFAEKLAGARPVAMFYELTAAPDRAELVTPHERQLSAVANY